MGKELAREFARRGARIALVDIDDIELERIYTELRAYGADAMSLECDVTSAEACGGAVDEILAEWGRLDVLVNNAGMSHRSFFEDTDDDVLQKVMDVNFWGSVRMTRAALDALLASDGHIAVMSSVAGFAPLTGRTAYAASKHALHGFFESLRTEIADRNVDVTMICPSFVDNELSAVAADGADVDTARADVGAAIEAEDLARRAVDAIIDRRPRLVPTSVAKVAWWLSRVAPSLYEKLMRRSQTSEFPHRDESS